MLLFEDFDDGDEDARAARTICKTKQKNNNNKQWRCVLIDVFISATFVTFECVHVCWSNVCVPALQSSISVEDPSSPRTPTAVVRVGNENETLD